MSDKHLETGAPLPPITKDTMRIYNMRFCPYAERTRLVLAYKQIPHDTINVHLRKKPEWFVERNPEGKVPVLEFNNEVVYESAICDEYLDEKYPDNKLLPDDPYQRARAKILMDGVAKVATAFYGVGLNSGEKQEKAREDAVKNLDRYEKALTGKFFGGDSPNMIDFHMWPWVERFPPLKELTGVDVLPADRFPKLKQWVEDMMATPVVKAQCLSTEKHVRYFKSHLAGQPEYDPVE